MDDWIASGWACVVVGALGFVAGFPWGALWATRRQTPGPFPWTNARGRPMAGPLPIQPGEQIPIEDLMKAAERRTIDKGGEAAVPPTEDLATKVGDRLGPEV